MSLKPTNLSLESFNNAISDLEDSRPADGLYRLQISEKTAQDLRDFELQGKLEAVEIQTGPVPAPKQEAMNKTCESCRYWNRVNFSDSTTPFNEIGACTKIMEHARLFHGGPLQTDKYFGCNEHESNPQSTE